MSVIQVQALREAKSSRKKDEEIDLNGTGHDKPSRAPYFVGASIAALVLYLKTAYSAHAETPPESADDSHRSEENESFKAQDQVSHEKPFARHSNFHHLNEEDEGKPGEDAIEQVRRALTDEGWSLDDVPVFQFVSAGGLPRFLSGLGVSRMRTAALANDNGAADTRAYRGGAVSGSSSATKNRSPTAEGPVFLQNGFATMAVLFTLDDLLKGATDPDQDQLSVVHLQASSGQFIPVDGGYMYIGDVTGPVSVTYDITDGLHVIPQQAYLDVKEHAVTLGTTSVDNIVGSDSADLIAVGAGADSVSAGDGMDTIYADDGDDLIHGGAGNDLVIGGAGNDKLFGDDGNDVIFGGLGNDEVHGGKGNDTLYGNEGDDTIAGDEGNDTLFGNAGKDVLSDGAGQDYVSGGADNDRIVVAADGEDDSFDGGAGTDTISFASSTTSVTINAVAGTATGAGIGHDAIHGFETYEGGSGNDTFIVGQDAADLVGGGGYDIFRILTSGATASAPIRHVIEDFHVGDRVEMSGYDIFEDGDTSQDFLAQMNALGNGTAPDSAVPVRFRVDDATTKTWIEADFDHDNNYEVSVELDGHHNLLLHLNSHA
ncbi:cadherin-like domain-containing protein [Aestuariivirga sp.]|uniref:cadherin-like domain-containing protein n=1 Tax=Aestuariivirga sp. TaxID=2650926 RepID=UPI0039E41D88